MSKAGPRRVRTVPGLWRRLGAGAVDVALSGAVTALLVGLGALSVQRWAPAELPLPEHVAVTWNQTWRWTLAQWTLAWTPLVVLHTATAVLSRRTPGAALFGLVVVGPDGHAATSTRGVVRALAYLTWPLTLLLGPAMVLVSPSQRGLHDWISGTCVVRDPASTPRRAPA